MRKKNAGFTLVELLVVIVILGIITGISIPLIRNIQASSRNKKFQTFESSLVDSAKLYTDSYSPDMFGNSNYGCALIRYEDMEKKTLIKDIQVSDSSCSSADTYVRVIKLNDKYTYETKLTCKDKKSNKNVFTSNKIEDGDMECSGGAISKGPTIEFNPEKDPIVKAENATKYKSVNIVVKSDYGIKEGSSFFYAWSLKEDGSDLTSTDWKQKKIIGSKAELEKVHYMGRFNVNNKNKPTGDYYLFVRTTDNNGMPVLIDAASNASTTVKYHSGVYVVDKTAPVITNLNVTSEKAWNSVNLKLQMNDTKDAVNGKDIKVCLKQGNGSCDAKDYVAPDKAKLKLTGVTYNGATVDVKIRAKDLAGNEAVKSVKYNLYQECQTANLVKTTVKAEGACSKKCGGGTRTDVYNTKDKNSGNNCSGKTINVPNVACNTMACCSKIKYKDGTNCTKKCGGGTYNRLAYSAYDDSRCASNDTTSGGSACNTMTCCSSVSTTYGAWSGWNSCSKKCGGGTQTSTRSVVKKSNYDGSTCSNTTESRSQSCNTTSCCSSVNTTYGAWSGWGACSKKCDKGTQTRTRTVTKKSAIDGSSCGTSTETGSQTCNTQGCCSSVSTTYGSWTGWSSCSKTCGGGTQTRSRSVVTKSNYTGGVCTSTTQTGSQACNTQACAPTIKCCKSGKASGVWTVSNGVASRPYHWRLHGFKAGDLASKSVGHNYEIGWGNITYNSNKKWVWHRDAMVTMTTNGKATSGGAVSNSCTVQSSTGKC